MEHVDEVNNYSQQDVRLLIQHLASNLNQLRPRFARAERARSRRTFTMWYGGAA